MRVRPTVLLPVLSLFLAAPAASPAALAQGTASYTGSAASPQGATTAGNPRQFHVVTVHVDGATALQATAAHPAEAFPTESLPPGGGLLLRQPDASGAWSVRAFMFHPPQIVVTQGEPVTLTFVDVQGVGFRIAVDGVAEPVAIRRGQARSVTVRADQPGRIGFRSLDQGPSMAGEVLVLPAR